MKKLFAMFIVCMSLAALPLMAAYQYGDYVYYDQFNGNKLRVIKDGSLTLNFSPVSHAYGYKITDWNTLTVKATNASGSVLTKTVGIGGSSIDIGQVMQGDSLEFYLTGKKGTTVSSHFWGSGWDTSAGTFGSYDYLHFGSNYGVHNSKYMNQRFQIEGGPSPSGQPLPGVAISLLLGGIGIYAARRRKAKAAD